MAKRGLYYDDGTGQFITVPAPVVAYPGNGTVGPYTITHNFGTLGTNVIVILNSTGEEVEVHKVRTQNTVVLSPDVVWNPNERTATVSWACQTDNTPPTTATLTFNSKTANSITVTPSGSTDSESGVAGYLIYKDGVAVNGLSTLAPSGAAYQVTGLIGSTQYSITAKGVDNGGNISAAFSTAVVQTTDTSAAVVFNAAGTNGTATGSQANWTATSTITIAAGSNITLLGFLLVDHGGGGLLHTAYTPTVSDSVHGSMTMHDGVSCGTAGAFNGGLHVFKYHGATAGAHTVTATINTGATWITGAKFFVIAYSNCGSVVTDTKRDAVDTAATLNISGTAATGDFSLVAAGLDGATQWSAFNRTSRANFGANTGGGGDWLLVGDVAATGAAQAFTASPSAKHGAITIDLVKAA